MTADLRFASAYRDAGVPDPISRPDLFYGVLSRRAMAYLVDLCCIGTIAVIAWCVFAVLWVMSFGLLGPVLWFLFGLIPLAYHTLLISGRHSATFGMRLFDLQLRSWTGDPPSFLQALAHTLVFYFTVWPSCGLALLFVLINRRRQTLHDLMAGMLMVRNPERLMPPAVTPSYR